MITPSLLVGSPHESGILGNRRNNAVTLREWKLHLGRPGRCPATPTLTIFVADDSGSLSGPSGNDPVSNRYAEARRALDVIGRHCHCGSCLVAVVHFDTPTPGCVDPTPLTRHGRNRIASGLGVPRDAAGTSRLGPSLTRSVELVSYHPGHEIVLIILTDWALFDHDLSNVYGRITAFPGAVFAVGLRSPVPEAVAGPNIRSFTVSVDSPPGDLARAVFEGMAVHRRPRFGNAGSPRTTV